MFKSRESHERPTGVRGQWVDDTREGKKLTMLQKIADKTSGWVTPSNFLTAAGGAAVVKGGIELKRGNYNRALGWIVLGRAMDIADGYVAQKTRTKGEVGAGLDAGLDKALALIGSYTLAEAGIISPGTAIVAAGEQLYIFGQNVRIQRAGGKPTPGEAGKHGIFAFSTSASLRVAQRAAEQNYPRLASTLDVAADLSEVAALVLMHQAGQEYKQEADTLN